MLFVIIQKEIVSDVLKKISKTHFEFFFFYLNVTRLPRHAARVFELDYLIELVVFLYLLALPDVYAVLFVVPPKKSASETSTLVKVKGRRS